MSRKEIKFEEVDLRDVRKKAPGRKDPGTERLYNREFTRVTYIFVILFLVLTAYIIYFNFFRAKEIINSPYNRRQDAFAERIIRGDITDRNGEVLAQTLLCDDGTQERYYPFGETFAHVIGFCDACSGKSGLEAMENFDLLTSDSFFMKRVFNDLNGRKNMGDTVVTTLDAGLQQEAYSALGENKGAVIVMEPDTGRILCMVSSPSFDPNSAAENFEELNSDEDTTPLLNRAAQGLYAPGSVFKIVTALEYIRENHNYKSYEYECTGQIEDKGTVISCYGHTAHGVQDLKSSFANSCNSSFANIGLSLDRKSYKKTAEELLFNRELPSVLDYSKSSFKIDKDSSDAEMMMTAMGQGRTMVSPYHMALITSAVAFDGVLMKPYLVEKVTNHSGAKIRESMPENFKRLMTSREAAQLKDYMAAVVENGTATVLSGRSYTAAGKTGTAEYSGDDSGKTHSWFTGFTDVENPDLVITVVLEGCDDSGGPKAVDVAAQILDFYYE